MKDFGGIYALHKRMLYRTFLLMNPDDASYFAYFAYLRVHDSKKYKEIKNTLLSCPINKTYRDLRFQALLRMATNTDNDSHMISAQNLPGLLSHLQSVAEISRLLYDRNYMIRACDIHNSIFNFDLNSCTSARLLGETSEVHALKLNSAMNQTALKNHVCSCLCAINNLIQIYLKPTDDVNDLLALFSTYLFLSDTQKKN